MIKPEDLRIGNWVEHYGETITVDGIDDIDVFNKKCGEIPLHSITPIPLTEKILLDCGFYIDETKNASIMLPNNEVLILELNDKGIYTDYAYGTEIEYLHNLQNLHKELSKTNLIYKIMKTELTEREISLLSMEYDTQVEQELIEEKP